MTFFDGTSLGVVDKKGVGVVYCASFLKTCTGTATVKSFEALFAELQAKVEAGDPNSGTVKAVEHGTHFIGKKILEEAGEVWMASQHEGRERTAEEISQLLYHAQVMMIACGLELDDVYRHL